MIMIMTVLGVKYKRKARPLTLDPDLAGFELVFIPRSSSYVDRSSLAAFAEGFCP